MPKLPVISWTESSDRPCTEAEALEFGLTTGDPLDCEVEHKLPGKFAICSHCQGTGGSSAYLGAITESDRAEWDDEEWESYMSGGYDRCCDQCSGTGKVAVVDEDRCDKALLGRYLKRQRYQVQEDYNDRRTMWMEDGGRGNMEDY